jgi:beta-glucosidase
LLGLPAAGAAPATTAPPAVAATAGTAGTGQVSYEESVRRARALVARMTLDEKISQAHTTGSGVARRVVGIPRLGIPDFNITNGPAGVGTGTVSPQPTATALPAPVALAASFDPLLAREYGVVEGRETLDVNHDLIEAPDVNILRVPQGGRDFENFSEDPYLSARTAVSNIEGIQSQGAISEVKHYVANEQETDRKTVDERVDDRTLHEIYMQPFEAAVKEAGVGAVMCAYPSVNGEFMCENKHLLTDVIRGQWGFRGFIQSDYTATHSAKGSVDAGMDLELRDNGPYDQQLKQAVLDGQVSEQALDELLVRRIATVIRFGSYDHGDTTRPIDFGAGADTARKVAEAGTVLLKNDHATLPLSPGLSSVAVVGPYAEQAHPGGGGSSHVEAPSTVSPVEGLQQRLGPDVTVRHSDGSDVAAAVQQAAASDVAVVVVGDEEAEGSDRSSLALPGNQDQLVQAVAAANPRTVVVVDSGAPVLMPWVDSVPAVVEAWYPGEQDGAALASVLTGDVNPGGKLPVTFPRSEARTPTSTPDRFPGIGGTVQYSEGLQVGYRWYDANDERPLFPFGYGLSYTSFRVDRLTATPHVGGSAPVQVSARVTNTGDRAGSDVAQVYVEFPTSAGEPPRQLVAYRKVELAPGESRVVRWSLPVRSFSVWDSAAQDWRPVDGRFTVWAGDSSRDLPEHAPVVATARR